MFHKDDKLSKPETSMDLEIKGQPEHGSISDNLKCLAACKVDVCGEKGMNFLLQQASGSRTFVWGWEIRALYVNDLTENLTSLDEALTEGLSNIPYYLDWDIHPDGEATSLALTQPNKDTLPPKVSNVS